jgi:hypothetical protein
MKFGQQLLEYRQDEWKEHYLPYKSLKKQLKSVSNESETVKADGPLASETVIGLSRIDLEVAPADQAQDELWRRSVDAEVQRIAAFIEQGLQELERQIVSVEASARGLTDEEPVEKTSPFSQPCSADMRLFEEVADLGRKSRQLMDFQDLNRAALFKIFKKYDKQLERTDGLAEHCPLIEKTAGLSDRTRFDAIHAELRQVHALVAWGQPKESPEVVQPITGLSAAHDSDNVQERTGSLLWFCFGSSIALLMCIIVLLVLPPGDLGTFSWSQLLSPFPVFYSAFWVLFALWCIGFVIRVCDRSGINHLFILGIDPRLKARPHLFLWRAAALTAVWVFLFGAYVVEFKWSFVFPLFGLEGPNRPFFIYPISVLVVLLLVAALPSLVSCRRRGSVLGSLFRTVCAPLFPVCFADNIMGDVLTSLVKPMQDIPSSICYLLADHPHSAGELERFVQNGNVCPAWEHSVVDPIIAALPLVIRALQCLRRFYDSPSHRRHLMNFGKYMTSLSVIFVSAIYGQGTAVIVLSAAATVYSATWDIKVDWGIGLSTLISPRSDTPTSAAQRCFRPRTYILASIIDIALRLVWVLSLLPVASLLEVPVNRVAFRAVVSALELCRRSMWFVLRVEHEQAANGGGFRGLMWVPKTQKPSLARSATSLAADNAFRRRLA